MFKIAAIVGMVTFSTVALLGCGTKYTESDREKLCEPLIYNKKGQLVKIVISGQKGMVIGPESYMYELSFANSQYKLCSRRPMVVRINAQGIALDSGLWDTARPEVLPTLELFPFEVESWKD